MTLVLNITAVAREIKVNVLAYQDLDPRPIPICWDGDLLDFDVSHRLSLGLVVILAMKDAFQLSHFGLRRSTGRRLMWPVAWSQ